MGGGNLGGGFLVGVVGNLGGGFFLGSGGGGFFGFARGSTCQPFGSKMIGAFLRGGGLGSKCAGGFLGGGAGGGGGRSGGGDGVRDLEGSGFGGMLATMTLN